ncbi:TrkA family potassium uptake protein [Oscillibacter hominis]|uniref:TrkA family potassium uptake protein n=1 Tax=Oscillibacter hominis TaxID=2763056 RepID=A0A7G9B457_9FIRM|nr:TrkA family potassium uptake protein [Oscillibacter hominis]QNL44338.1 TrkA family potassium uptake protein [Oscillibacter hominis]
MRSMLVIGLGRFGSNLALKLTELGNEVLVVDKDDAVIEQIAPLVTRAQIGDCMDESILRSLGVRNFDVCFVCISDDFQSSLEITSLLKDLGAPYVVAKANRDIHAKFLRKIGADEVVYPERDMAKRAAVRFSVAHAFDYIELSEEYALFELEVPSSWVGKTLKDLDIRSRHSVNVIGVRENGRVTPITNADRPFTAQEHLLLCGGKEDVLRLTSGSSR